MHRPFSRFLSAVYLLVVVFFPHLVAVPCAHAEARVPVLLMENLSRVTIIADGSATVLTPRASLPRLFVPGIHPLRVQNRAYRGTLEVQRDGLEGLRVINHVGLEDYLRGVVPSEMPAHWPPEALKAQAVAARTYALYRMQRAFDDGVTGFLKASVMDQVYRGVRAESGPTDAAVAATRGEALALDGRWLVAYFHSSCGGRSERPASVWGISDERRRDAVWMAANERVFGERDDPGCVESPWSRWRTSLSKRQVATSLGKLTGMRSVDRIAVAERTSSGRVSRFLVVGGVGRRRVEKTINAQAARMAIGPQRLRSLSCTVESTGDRIVFEGAGWGHGVGLCQWGARGRAERGDDYRAILAAYYPGAWLARAGD